MNRPNDMPRLTAAHLSAVDPGLLERVKDIFSDFRTFSSHRQVSESSFTSSLTYSSRHDRLLDPAGFREKLSDLPKHAYNTGPGGQSPAVDPVKPDKKLDGWLPAPSGLRRKGVAERVTGHNLPQALNECADKSASEDFRLKNLYQAGTDIKGRESGWDPRVQGYSAADKPPWSMPYPVNDSPGRWSDGQRLARQNAEGTCSASNEMRGALPAYRTASSSATKPDHYSQVAEGQKASVSVREQQRVELSLPGSDKHALNSMYSTETSEWRPATVGYDAVSRAVVSQGEAGVDASSAAKWPLRTGNASSYPDSDVIVARRIFNDYQRIEFESFGQTLMVLKTSSEDVGAPPSSRDSAKLKDDRRREDMSASQRSIRDSARVGDAQFSSHRADLARKSDPVEDHERSRVEFGEEMVRRARTDLRITDDSERKTSGSQSSLPVVYRDYHHRSSVQEPSGASRKSSAERDLLSGRAQATDSWRLEKYSAASAEKSARKSEDRSKSKKSVTDDFLRTKFLLEIERREKELRRIADNSGSHGIVSIAAILPHMITAGSHFGDDREKWPKKQDPKCDSLRMLEPEKRSDSDRISSHTVKPISASVSSSRLPQEYLSHRDEVAADVRSDRSRRLDDISSSVFEGFRRPLPPTRTDYRIPEEHFIGEKQRNFSSENSADVKKQHYESQSFSKNSSESATRSSRSSTYIASADDGIRSSASDRHKTNPEGEVSGGFQREEQVAYWENLKAQLENVYSKNKALKAELENEYSKKQSPVESKRRSSEGKGDSQSTNSSKVKEGGTTPKEENSEQHGRFRAKMELTPKRERAEEQSKVHAKMERTTSKKEHTESEKGMVRVKTEAAEERSFSQSKEAKKNSAEIQDRLPATTKQSVRPVRSLNSSQKVSNQGKAAKQATRTDEGHSLNSNQKVTNQGKTERPTTRTDQVHSLNKSQNVGNQVKTEKNVASKQKLVSHGPNKAASKADLEKGKKGPLPKAEEKRAADEKQDAKKTKIVTKNATKTSHQPIAEANKNASNSNVPRRATAEHGDIASKDDPKSGDLRNLLNAMPGNTKNWHKREVKRLKDDTSVVLIGDPISEDEDELVIEVPDVRRRQAEVSVESLGAGRALEIDGPGDPRRSTRRWQAVDDDLDSELPKKRFKFNLNSHERFVRGGGFGQRRGRKGRRRRAFDFNQRCVIDRRSTTQIRFEGDDRCSDAVDLDDYRHGDADLDDRRPGHREQYDEAGYFETDDRSRISNPRNRYQGRSRDRSYAVDQRRGDDEDLFPCDADDRFLKNDNDEEYYEDRAEMYRRGDHDDRRSESYSRERGSTRDEERFPKRESGRESYEEANEDARQRDNEDYDGRFSSDSARKHFRQRSSARHSHDDSDERYRDDRSARYSSDDGNDLLRSRRYKNETDEQFHVENDTDDVGEQYQGPYTDRPARYKRKPGRGRFTNPIARTITFDRLKEPRSFLKDLEENCIEDDYAEEEGDNERPCDIEVTIEGDFYDDDNNDYARDAVYKDVEGMVRDVRFEDSHARTDEFDYGGLHDEAVSPLLPDGPSHTATRFGGPSRGSSFRTRPWRGRFFHRSAPGSRFQHRFGPRGRFGFQPHGKRFLPPPPKKYLRKMSDAEFAEQSEENIHISKPSNSIQEAVKQVMSNLKEAEMADPEADAALFDTLSRGEKKQVIEIQQMTGIQCVTAIVTALRTLWEFEPKVVRTLGNLEPEEIKQLGDDG